MEDEHPMLDVNKDGSSRPLLQFTWQKWWHTNSHQKKPNEQTDKQASRCTLSHISTYKHANSGGSLSLDAPHHLACEPAKLVIPSIQGACGAPRLASTSMSLPSSSRRSSGAVLWWCKWMGHGDWPRQLWRTVDVGLVVSDGRWEARNKAWFMSSQPSNWLARVDLWPRIWQVCPRLFTQDSVNTS